ncbi:MAG: hypothetical protein WBX25_08365 [Rhodomicrobium sp.]
MTFNPDFDAEVARNIRNRNTTDEKPSRIEELTARTKELYAEAQRLDRLEPVARRVGIIFANNIEARGLSKRAEKDMSDIFSEAGRVERAIACEPYGSLKDALLAMLATGWRFDSFDDDDNVEIFEGVWKGVIDVLERFAGATAEDLGYGAQDARRVPRHNLIEKIACYERLADMAAAEMGKQTKEDLRGRLIAIFNANRDCKDDEDDEGDAYEAMTKGEEIILNLEGDDPNLIAAKLIITLSGQIIRDMKDSTRDTRKQAEAAMSALRFFGLEALYRECYTGDGVRQAAS